MQNWIDILQTVALCIGSIALTVIAIFVFFIGMTLLSSAKTIEEEDDDDIDIAAIRRYSTTRRWRNKDRR
ncbi:MAG: hypothetical protein JXB07_00135 [Anaerolineae bacterium]|nr:hypothetical protein [Anaerolineae bacterium]